MSPGPGLAPNREALELFDGLPARYDALAYVLSMGQDRRWRRAAVGQVRAGPSDRLLDVATGPGGVALALKESTGADVVGVDLTPQMLARAVGNLSRRGERRIRLVRGRGEELPFPDGTFAGATFSYLLRYVADPKSTIAELARVIRPGGVLASLEFGVPGSAFWRALWRVYTRALLPAGGLLLGGREWFEVGRFLGPSISEHYRRFPVAETVTAWEAAGMQDVSVLPMSLGGGLVMLGTRSGGC